MFFLERKLGQADVLKPQSVCAKFLYVVVSEHVDEVHISRQTSNSRFIIQICTGALEAACPYSAPREGVWVTVPDMWDIVWPQKNLLPPSGACTPSRTRAHKVNSWAQAKYHGKWRNKTPGPVKSSFSCSSVLLSLSLPSASRRTISHINNTRTARGRVSGNSDAVNILKVSNTIQRPKESDEDIMKTKIS